MAKVSWGTSGDAVDDVEVNDFPTYDGPLPPAGVYRLALRKAEYTKFSTGKKGISLFLVIDDNRPEKKRYNGCPVWENLVDTEESTPFIRRWMDAIGGTGKDWDNTQIDKENNVTKHGRIALDGMMVRASLKRGNNNRGDDRVEVARFLPKGEAQEAGDTDEGDNDEAPF